MEIKILERQGLSVRAIARELGVSRNTVRRHLRTPQAQVYGPRAPRPKKLDPFREYIRERVAASTPEGIASTVLLRELRERGYTGQISQLRDFVRSIQPPPAVETVVRFETEPGIQMQADWAIFNRKERLVAFVATLGYSRAAFVRYCDNERVETLIECLIEAFNYFGGVPTEVLFDNTKTVVITRDAFGPQQHRFHPGLWDFARHCNFMPRLCRPYRAKTKGKVERFIRYLRSSFHRPLASRLQSHGLSLDVATANCEVRRWLDRVANTRVHATTEAIPFERLTVEREHLQSVPAHYSGHRVVELHIPASKPTYPNVPPQHDIRQYDRLFLRGAA